MSQKYYSEITADMSMVAMLDGRLFRWFNKFTLTPLATKEFLIKIPNDPTTLLFHGRSFSSSGAGCTLEVFVSPQFTSEGTPISTFFNLDGNSANAAEALIWESPVITSTGLLADVDATYGSTEASSGVKGSTGSEATKEFPRIMPKDVYILARVTNLSTSMDSEVIYKLFWEEINK